MQAAAALQVIRKKCWGAQEGLQSVIMPGTWWETAHTSLALETPSGHAQSTSSLRQALSLGSSKALAVQTSTHEASQDRVFRSEALSR